MSYEKLERELRELKEEVRTKHRLINTRINSIKRVQNMSEGITLILLIGMLFIIIFKGAR